MERAAQVLFEYLKNILYNPDKAALDLCELPDEFRRLGEGMQFLGQCVKEERAFAQALARGDLSCPPPDGNNVLAAPIKALQGSLRHLAWQTKQVAKGDYNQKVDFMGEFSESFNLMTRQLRDRTAGLQAEKEVVEQKNLELRQTLELVLALTNYTHNMIFVFSASTNKLIFKNQAAEWMLSANGDAAKELQQKLNEHAQTLGSEAENWDTEADVGGDTGTRYYGVESFNIAWEEEQATVHILMDVTERKKRENLVHTMAYIDPLTGLSNRRYAFDRMGIWVATGVPFLISFVDVDYLKYCNDTFGHGSGDQYLKNVSGILGTLGAEVCRVGGDEFLLLQPGIDAGNQDKRLKECREKLIAQTETPYPQSFSFATTAVPAHPEKTLDKYIRETDIKMYEYKKKYKQPLREAGYIDKRI